MAAKKSSFNKVLNAWDVLVIAFGAMIGWAWVVSTGDWITGGGVFGAMLGFAIGGVGIVFVAASVLTGSSANLEGQLFMGATTSEMAKGTLSTSPWIRTSRKRPCRRVN
ncbi:MAG: hypothetical protein ACI4N8_07020 [Megasphaera sp.]|uniref:hypothetical protein n=1 Tax=Megasphaera sp. TaxID=2023260 RepID=UPI003F0D847C